MLVNRYPDVRQTLDHFHRSVDQLFENFLAPTGYHGTGPDGAELGFTVAVETGWTDDNLNLRVVIEGERKTPEHFGGGSLHPSLFRRLSHPTKTTGTGKCIVCGCSTNSFITLIAISGIC